MILNLQRNIYKNLMKGINKMNIEKLKSENITHEKHMNNVLQDVEYQKMYLDTAIQEFITDGDYDLFFQSLEQVIKARMSISEFSQKTGIVFFFSPLLPGNFRYCQSISIDKTHRLCYNCIIRLNFLLSIHFWIKNIHFRITNEISA